MLKKICIVIITSLLLIIPVIDLVSTSSIASTISEIEQKKKDAENKKNEAENKKNEINENIKETKSELETLNDAIAEKEYEVEKITEELNTLTAEVNKLTQDLKNAEEEYNTKYDTLCKRLAAQAKAGSVSYLDVLLNSKSLTDFISKYYIIGKIAEYDTELLEDIEEQKHTIETSKKEMEQKQSKVAEKQKQLKVEEIQLTNNKSNKTRYISKLSAEEQALQKEIDEYNNTMKECDRQILAISNPNGSTYYTGGKLNWPCSNYRISSYFGYRGSAATGGVGTANHNGYDLAAPHGTPLYAAESGTVIKVVTGCTHDYPKTFKTRCYCGGGYGNYFMIQHDNGLTTLYGHCATVGVSLGQRVSRGQQVGTVGSCGWSTGNHVHFSVILNGKYVNPGNYLG